MANISAQTMQGFYKNFLVMNNTGNTGVSSTAVSVQDGAGTVIPLALTKTAFKIKSGASLIFGTGNMILNSGASELKLKTNKIVLNGIVSITGKTHIGLASAVSFHTASTIRTKHFKLSGNASMASATVGVIRGTTIHGTTISATTFKGNVDFTSLTKSIKLSENPLYLRGATTLIKADSEGIKIQYAGTGGALAHRITASVIIPAHNTVDLGKSASAFKTMYLGTANITTANITTANINNGTFTAIGAIGASKLTVSTVSMKREFKLNGVSAHLDTAKRFSIKYTPSVSAIALKTAGTTAIYFKSDHTFYPASNGIIDLGLTAKRWKDIYTGNLYATTNLEFAGTASGKYANVSKVTTVSSNATDMTRTKYLVITGIPVTSTGCVSGQVYSIAGALKII